MYIQNIYEQYALYTFKLRMNNFFAFYLNSYCDIELDIKYHELINCVLSHYQILICIVFSLNKKMYQKKVKKKLV